jgi:hypothetical protein
MYWHTRGRKLQAIVPSRLHRHCLMGKERVRRRIDLEGLQSAQMVTLSAFTVVNVSVCGRALGRVVVSYLLMRTRSLKLVFEICGYVVSTECFIPRAENQSRSIAFTHCDAMVKACRILTVRAASSARSPNEKQMPIHWQCWTIKRWILSWANSHDQAIVVA